MRASDRENGGDARDVGAQCGLESEADGREACRALDTGARERKANRPVVAYGHQLDVAAIRHETRTQAVEGSLDLRMEGTLGRTRTHALRIGVTGRLVEPSASLVPCG